MDARGSGAGNCVARCGLDDSGLSDSALVGDDPMRARDYVRHLAGQRVTRLFASTGALELAEVCYRVVVFFHGWHCATLATPHLCAQTTLEAINTGQRQAHA